jgi:hypothetical protein
MGRPSAADVRTEPGSWSTYAGGLGGAVVLGEDDRGAGAGGQLADQPVVCVRVAEDPRAVQVDDRRERTGGVLRADHPDAHLAGGPTGDGQVFEIDGRLGDLAGLDLVDGLAAFLRAELVEVRRLGNVVAVTAQAAASGRRRRCSTLREPR